MNKVRARMVAAGLSAGLIGGGAAGMVLGTAGVSGAQDGTTTTVQAEESTDDRAAEFEQRRRERLSGTLAPLVDAGTIDQSQAEAVIDALVAERPGRGGRGWHPGKGLDAVAEALGVEQDALRTALRDGQTLAEIAEANGVDPQELIDQMVAELGTRLDEKVAEGDLTREQADEKLAEGTERITERVNEGGGRGPGGGVRGPGGRPGGEAPEGD